jgi:tight adherence protein B
MKFADLGVISFLSWAALLGLGYAGLLVTRETRRQEKLASRITAVVAPHTRVQRIELSPLTRLPTAERESMLSRLASLFGFNLKKLDRYPLRWWLVLMITFAVAKGAEQLASDMIDSFGLLVLPIAWVLLSRMTFGWFDKRFQDKLLQQFPDALAMIVRTVRVGIPVLRAIRNVANDAPAPTREVFARLLDQVSIGVALDKAMLDIARHAELPEYGFFATAITLQMQTGGALSESLENLADVIRKRVALKARALALASEARTSAAVLAALPVVSGGAIWALNPSYMGALFEPGLGRTILSGAILSLGCGLLVIRSLIRASLK